MSSRSDRLALTLTTAVCLIGVVLAVVGLVAALRSEAATHQEGPPLRAGNVPTEAFLVTVDHVVDGDTFAALYSEAGDARPAIDRVRLIGIDTPELSPEPECGATEATEHLRALLPVGSQVWALPDLEPQDRFRRTLLYIWTTDGLFVNRDAVEQGFARTLPIEPNTRYAEEFSAAAEGARRFARGVWGTCA